MALGLVVANGTGCGRADDAPLGEAEATVVSGLPLLGPAPCWALRRPDGSLLRSEDLAGQVRHRKVGLMDRADYEAVVRSLL